MITLLSLFIFYSNETSYEKEAVELEAMGAITEVERSQQFIVQARDVASARQAVLSVGGSIGRELEVINAVAADLSPSQKDKLESSVEVIQVWENLKVNSVDSPEQGSFYPPITASEADGDDEKVSDLAACDGDHLELEDVPEDGFDPNFNLTMAYAPELNLNSLPDSASVHISFEGEELGGAILEIYQASSNRWIPFELDLSLTDNESITADFDVTDIRV